MLGPPDREVEFHLGLAPWCKATALTIAMDRFEVLGKERSLKWDTTFA